MQIKSNVQISFIEKYLGRLTGDPDFENMVEIVFNAFKLGRAAIVAGDYALRDQQANIVQENLSMMIGIRAVYYLQQAKIVVDGQGTVDGGALHDLSEGYGFIYSLRFTKNTATGQSYFSREEVDQILNDFNIVVK